MENKKTIIGIAIAAILLATAVYLVGVAVVKKDKPAEIQTGIQPSRNNEEEKEKRIEIVNEKGEKQEVSAVIMSTRVASGKVSEIGDSQISIAAEEGEKTLKITDRTHFYSMADGKAQTKALSDVKIGANIAAEYNEADDTALAVSL